MRAAMTITMVFGVATALAFAFAYSLSIGRTDGPRQLPSTPEGGAFVDGRLWLSDDRGQLWVIDPERREAVRQTIPSDQPTSALCVQDGRLIAMAGRREKPETFELFRREGAGWSRLAVLPAQGDHFIGLGCGVQGPVLVTTRRLLSLGNSGEVASVPLDRPYTNGEAWATPTVLVTDRQLVVALDEGEFGGTLRQIDRETGASLGSRRLPYDEGCEHDTPDALCGPVSGVRPAPWAPGCVVAVEGVAHMGARYGAVATVCDGRVTEQWKGHRCGLSSRDCTEPLVGLATHRGKLIAVGQRSLSTLSRQGLGFRRPLPGFKRYGPFKVSFAHPQLILVGYDRGAPYPTQVRFVTVRNP